MGQIGSPETSVCNFHSTLRNVPEESRSHIFLFSETPKPSVGPIETHIQWVLLWGYSDQVVKLTIYVQFVSMLTMGAAIFLLNLHAFTVGTGTTPLYPSVNYDLKPHAQAKFRVQTCRSFNTLRTGSFNP